jgi:hypothetical protein
LHCYSASLGLINCSCYIMIDKGCPIIHIGNNWSEQNLCVGRGLCIALQRSAMYFILFACNSLLFTGFALRRITNRNEYRQGLYPSTLFCTRFFSEILISFKLQLFVSLEDMFQGLYQDMFQGLYQDMFQGLYQDMFRGLYQDRVYNVHRLGF